MKVHRSLVSFQIWEIKSRRIRSTFEGHTQEIYSLDFSRDGMLIVSGSGDRTARIWNLGDGTHKVRSILSISRC